MGKEMGKEMEWWLTEPERNALMTEINELTDTDKKNAMEFIRALLKAREPT
jgi:hypothetical protein